MPHFFISPENIKDEIFVLKGSEAHHLARVLRYKPGQQLNLFDGTGRTLTGIISTIDDEEITGKIIYVQVIPPAAVHLNLFVSVPKGERLDWLVEKASELGVNIVIPLITSRSIVKEISANKLKRWERLSASASKQSGRSDLMKIFKPAGFEDALKMISGQSISIIAWEGEDKLSLDQAMAKKNKNFSEINLFIGPEGGFSFREIDLAKNAGLIPVTLGPRILRVETAGLVASALVLNTAGIFGGKQ